MVKVLNCCTWSTTSLVIEPTCIIPAYSRYHSTISWHFNAVFYQLVDVTLVTTALRCPCQVTCNITDNTRTPLSISLAIFGKFSPCLRDKYFLNWRKLYTVERPTCFSVSVLSGVCNSQWWQCIVMKTGSSQTLAVIQCN